MLFSIAAIFGNYCVQFGVPGPTNDNVNRLLRF